MSELISIVVPVYNTEKYLHRCINSLIKQTYKNIEILLINDGSTDNSEKICAEYMKANINVFVYTKPNGGLSDARNYGIEKASGSYIMFVDSDDFIAENMVEALYTDIVNHNADISSIDVFEFSNECYIFPNAYNSQNTITLDNRMAIKNIISNINTYNYAWNKLYNAKLFDTVKFPKGYVMEDLGTTYLLIYKAHKITYNPAKLYYYYQRENSILHSPNKKFYQDKYYLSEKRFLYIKDKYPECIENDKFMISVLVECFSYVKNNDAYKSFTHIMNIIDKHVVWSMSRSFRIKYIVFRINYFLYKLFERVKKCGRKSE